MPNIVVVGIVDGSVSKLIGAMIPRIVTGLGIDGKDGVVTYDTYPYLKSCDMTTGNEDSPYLIVRDTIELRAMRIANALNQQLNMDVEVELLHAFLPRRKIPTTDLQTKLFDDSPPQEC